MPNYPTTSDLQLLHSKLEIATDYLNEAADAYERYMEACRVSADIEMPAELAELRAKLVNLRKHVCRIDI